MKRPAAKVSRLTAMCLVIANMVGTGVFTSLGFQVVGLSSGLVILLLWTLGGVIAFCGALAYAELGTALPRSGGEYAFLSRIYSGPAGFLAAWISMIAGFPAAVALATIAFGRYLGGIVPGLPQTATACVMLLAITGIHWLGIRFGSRFQNTVTVAQVLLIAALVGSAAFVPWDGDASFVPRSDLWRQVLEAPFAISLVFVMFAYSGWNAATYITAEMADPSRNVPVALLGGTTLVTVLYVSLNSFFLLTTPLAAMRGQVEVGLIAARHAFGPTGGDVVGLIIALFLVSAVSAMVWVGPRVTMVLGEDYKRLGWLARRTPEGAPRPAMAVQTAVTLALVLTGTFESVLLYLQFALLLSSFFTALGVLVLRRREPELPRPYRTWGYPVTPVLFLLASAWMVVFILKERPTESLLGGLAIAAGLGLWAVVRRDKTVQGPVEKGS